MKPFILGNRQPFGPTVHLIKKARILSAHDIYLGGVDPCALPIGDPSTEPMFEEGKNYNYFYRDQDNYTGLSYLPLQGSVGWHTDFGIGLLLNWLVSEKQINGHKEDTYSCPQLITKHGALDLKVGDIFIFNGNLGHAWISNKKCLLLQSPVSARRKPRISVAKNS
jgi:hypothetical protein